MLNTIHQKGFNTILRYVKDIGWNVKDSLIEVNALGMLVSISPANIVFSDVLNGRVKDKELILHILNNIISSLPVSITLEDYVDALKLPGGLSIKRYEGRIVNFIANELIDVKVEQVNPVVNSLNGFMVKHPNATWACRLPIARGAGIQIAYWHGENGIPPGSSITYNTGIAKYRLSPSDIVLLAELAADRLVAMFRVKYGLKPKMYSSLYL